MTRDFVGDGEQTVIYELERMKRKTLSIHLEDDGRVVVKSPYGIKTVKFVHLWVKRHSGFWKNRRF